MSMQSKGDAAPMLPQSLQRKRMARLKAVQLLYQRTVMRADMSGEALWSYWQTHGDIAGERVAPKQSLLHAIITGVCAHEDALGDDVARCLREGWSAQRITTMLRMILLAALYELRYHRDYDGVMLVSEYTALAAEFLGEEEVGFVNASLDTMRCALRADAVPSQDA